MRPFCAKTSSGNQCAMRIMTPNWFYLLLLKKTFFFRNYSHAFHINFGKNFRFIANFYISQKKKFNNSSPLKVFCNLKGGDS